MKLQNPKFVLIAITGLFFAPLLLAIMMRSDWWDFKPANSANIGILVQPPLPLQVPKLEIQYSLSPGSINAQKQWKMLYPFPGLCAEQCQQDVAGLRQIHLATGRSRANVAVWLLSPVKINPDAQKKLVSIYPQLDILVDSAGSVTGVLKPGSDRARQDRDFWNSGQAFLLDPANNIILRYTAGFDPNDIKQDLERLLTWSTKE